MTSDEIHKALIEKYRKVMSITLGALIDYLQGDKFKDMTEAQKDLVFEHVVMGLGEMFPPELEHMWHKHLAYIALDHHLLAIQKEKEKQETAKTIDDIYNQLGWKFDD